MGQTSHACVAADGEEAVVRACGPLVLNGDRVSQAFEPAVGSRQIAWDLSRVTEIDAHGLGVLADAARKARERGVRVSVRAASAFVHRLASVARLDTVIPGDWHARASEAPPCRTARHALTPAGCGGLPQADP
jgi:anti-anti-sigma factor